MSRRKRWMVGALLSLALGLGVSGWGWWRLRTRRVDEVAYQLRLSRWGGTSHELPRPPDRLRHFRKYLGDDLYFTLAGGGDRVVGNGWPSAGREGATRAQLAELLEVQPIRTAFVAGSRGIDDDWIASLEDRASVEMLALDGTSVTDRSVATIGEMENLGALGLVDTAISDAAVDRLRRLPKLAHLYAGGPNIRSIRLVDGRVVDSLGRPATRSGGVVRMEGRIEVAGLPGELGYVRVMVRTDGDKLPRESFPYGWNARSGDLAMPTPQSPGVYTFRVDVAGIPSGRSSVEIWVDHHRLAPGPKVVFYRMQPFPIELLAPESGPAASPELPGR